MIYNYHTHTYRCKHASGTEEEYIIRAIENGVKHMGFSDHIPLKLQDGTESGYRVPVCEGKAYCEAIKALSEKYKAEIDIKVGFEMEYYPEYFDKMLKDAIEYGAEYLILGQHFVKPENTGTKYTNIRSDSTEALKDYVDSVIAAMKKKVFTYVAHPDIFNFTGDVRLYHEEMRRLCIASREMNVPLEINFLGIRDGRSYPNDLFWQIAGEEQAPVTFGFDAHDEKNAFDDASLKTAEKMVEEYNLRYIGKPELILIREGGLEA